MRLWKPTPVEYPAPPVWKQAPKRGLLGGLMFIAGYILPAIGQTHFVVRALLVLGLVWIAYVVSTLDSVERLQKGWVYAIRSVSFASVPLLAFVFYVLIPIPQPPSFPTSKEIADELEKRLPVHKPDVAPAPGPNNRKDSPAVPPIPRRAEKLGSRVEITRIAIVPPDPQRQRLKTGYINFHYANRGSKRAIGITHRTAVLFTKRQLSVEELAYEQRHVYEGFDYARATAKDKGQGLYHNSDPLFFTTPDGSEQDRDRAEMLEKYLPELRIGNPVYLYLFVVTKFRDEDASTSRIGVSETCALYFEDHIVNHRCGTNRTFQEVDGKGY